MAQLNTATVIGPARSFSNQLLASLPPALQQALAPSLATVHVEVKQMFHHQGEPVTDVYFPNDGVASITTMLADGATVEAATVGDEGMLGFEAFLGASPIAQGDTLLQVPGPSRTMEKMGTGAFRREIANHPVFREVMGRYTMALVSQMMHSSACNALHPV